MSDHVTRPRRAMAAGLAAVAAGAVGLVVAVASPASAHEGTEPVPTDENLDCADLAELLELDVQWEEGKIEPVPTEDGEYEFVLSDRGTPDDDSDDAVFTYTVYDNKRFDWSSTVGIDAIFVKGGAGAGGSYYYYFDGEELTEDVDYTVPPYNDSTKNAISHITICWDDENPGTTTTTQASTTTTTAPEETTTTTAPEETTTTTAPSSSSSSAPSSSVTTAPTTTTTTGEELPNTGSNSTMMLAGLGAALLAVGAGLVFATRKFWHRAA